MPTRNFMDFHSSVRIEAACTQGVGCGAFLQHRSRVQYYFVCPTSSNFSPSPIVIVDSAFPLKVAAALSVFSFSPPRVRISTELFGIAPVITSTPDDPFVNVYSPAGRVLPEAVNSKGMLMVTVPAKLERANAAVNSIDLTKVDFMI